MIKPSFLKLIVTSVFLASSFSVFAQEGQLSIPPMPTNISNNAVAELNENLYSFSGLGQGKTHNDILSVALEFNAASGIWSKLPNVLGNKHRLASIAVTVKDRIFVIGGYTVGNDNTEASTPEVFAFNPITQEYKRRADMPIPVDDTVAFPYMDRYIYLISGWHDTGNVSSVQLYDTLEDKWSVATPYPGTPVFGHAGGIVGNKFVITHGVGVVGMVEGRRQFDTVAESYLGIIDPNDPQKITWAKLPETPTLPLYRMAAMGDVDTNRIVFSGGATNAYNYNGIGYDGQPSVPSAKVFSWEFDTNTWRQWPDKATATMDHRGLLKLGDHYITLGGMEGEQRVSASVHIFQLGE